MNTDCDLTEKELARAIVHSKSVIDIEKAYIALKIFSLDEKNHIRDLKKKYQVL